MPIHLSGCEINSNRQWWPTVRTPVCKSLSSLWTFIISIERVASQSHLSRQFQQHFIYLRMNKIQMTVAVTVANSAHMLQACLLSCSTLLKAGPLNILRPGLTPAFNYTLGLLLHGNLDIGPRKKKSWPRALEKKRRALPRKKNMGAAKKLCSWLLRGTLHILIVFNTFTFEVLNDGMCQKYIAIGKRPQYVWLRSSVNCAAVVFVDTIKLCEVPANSFYFLILITKYHSSKIGFVFVFFTPKIIIFLE